MPAQADQVQRRGDGIGLPDERSVVCIQAPDKSVFRRFVGWIEPADIYPAIASAERALGRHKVFVRQPLDFTRRRVKAGGQAVVLAATRAAASGWPHNQRTWNRKACHRAGTGRSRFRRGHTLKSPFPTAPCPCRDPTPKVAVDCCAGSTDCRSRSSSSLPRRAVRRGDPLNTKGRSSRLAPRTSNTRLNQGTRHRRTLRIAGFEINFTENDFINITARYGTREGGQTLY